ncbi:MAG TPA: hypothetical protein VMZ71_14350 [Gemmataceae bacterium]|nr:hypothetical protein [Gemmataceae bacterium]
MPPPPAPLPADGEPLPRAQVRTACAVVGCLSLVVVAALAALVYIVLTVLGELTPQPAGTEKDRKEKKLTARPDPTGPTKLKTERDTVALDAPFDAVGRAANGRFLLLKVRDRLAVFDPVEAKVVKAFPLGEKDALFAGGAGKLFVYRPKAKELDQFDLLTGEKDETAKKPDAIGGVDHLVAGTAADEPVLAVNAGDRRSSEVAVIDPTPAAWKFYRVAPWVLTDARLLARTSADGRTVGVVGRPPGDRESKILRFTPPGSFNASLPRGTDPLGHLAPSPDGRYVYSARGVFDRDGKPALRPDGGYFYTLPAAHGGDLFLSVGVADDGKFEGPVKLHLAGERTAAAAFAGVRLPTGLDASDASEVPMDQRIHLWPAAGLLAVLPTSNAAIDMYKVDVPALLKNSGKDYLMFGSEPPTSATRGETLTYRPTVWSSAGSVTFDVTEPAGAVVKDSQLVWPVPQSGDEREVTVKLLAKAGNRPAEQSFRVLLVDPSQKP